MPQISNRAELAPFSPIRKLVPLARKAKKQGVEIFYLNIGQPDFETPCAIKKSLCQYQKCGPENIPYAPSEGIYDAILAWQKYYKDYNIKVNPEDIIITTGGSEAIIFSMAVICDPRDEIIVFEPFYANYKTYAKFLGIKLLPITLSIKNGFHLPEAKKIISKITKKTKAILVCNPSNPAGIVLSKKEIKTIVRIAKRYKLFILADEVYREFIFNGEEHISFMHFSEVKNQVILLDSVSKRFNACGVRIGVLVSKNKKVMQNALKFAQARLSVATTEQKAIIPLLLNSRPYTKKLIAQYRKRRDVVFEGLKNIPGVVCQKPEGAFYVIAKLPIDSSEKFCRWLLEKFRYKNKTVFLAPASDFYMTPGLGRSEARIAYVLNEKKLAEAMKILKRAVLEYNKQ
ncbi:MAG: pyridoxal phosphate-dependent aminotransferase [Patescibacteria group bacterium]